MSRGRALALLSMLLALTACGSEGAGGPACLGRAAAAPEGAWGRVEVHDGVRYLVRADGTRASVPAAPRRIVSTLPSITELVAYLAGSDLLVAVSPHCNFPPEVLAKPKVSVLPVNVEGLRALEPDLVLCDLDFHAQSLALLERHQFPVLMLETRSLAHLVTTVEVLGRLLDVPDAAPRARSLVASLHAAVARAGRDPREPPQRVLLVGQTDPLNVLGPGSLFDDLLRACGCINAACDLGRPSAPFSEESVLARAPDWILTTWEPLPARLRERWARVPAVAEGRVALASSDDLLRPGPRTPAALERLAQVLRGELPPERLSEGR